MDIKDNKMKELLQHNAWIAILRGPISNFNTISNKKEKK